MIRSFREYLAENISNGIKGNNLRGILEKFKDSREVIRYALYCAKEVEGYSKEAKVCNDTVEKWLKGEKVNLSNGRSDIRDIIFPVNPSYNSYFDTTVGDLAAFAAYYTIDGANTISTANYSVDADGVAPDAEDAADHAARAKSYHLYPDNETKRIIAYKHFLNEYIRLAQNWMRRWENAPEELKGISKISPEIIYDYLQDNPIVLSKVIPNKDGKYYLNISGMEKEFVGNSEEEVLSKVMSSGKREIVLRILSKIIGRG